MKQYFIVMALLLSLNAGQATAAPKSAHQRHQALTEQASHQGKTVKMDKDDKAKTYQQGIEAYSDTSSKATADDSIAQPVKVTHVVNRPLNKPEAFILSLLGGTLGAGSIALTIVIMLGGLLFLLAPFIAFIFLMKYLINRHNKRVELAEKAIENGVPIPDEVKSVKSESPEYYWKRGIRNVSLGVGCAIMFTLWGDANFFVGISLLWAFYGIGQLVISKTTK